MKIEINVCFCGEKFFFFLLFVFVFILLCYGCFIRRLWLKILYWIFFFFRRRFDRRVFRRRRFD